jgi:prepilin-type N-terminal cleavage/methylation domain-containing protein
MLTMRKQNRGFTLIELLVVIAIIGILSSIVLVSLNSARKKGADARIISDVEQIRTTLESDFNGSSYPDLANNTFASGSVGSSTIGQLQVDSVANGGSIVVRTNGATATAYAIFGQLTSQAAGTYFCIASNGTTQQAVATVTPTISCQ